MKHPHLSQLLWLRLSLTRLQAGPLSRLAPGLHRTRPTRSRSSVLLKLPRLLRLHLLPLLPRNLLPLLSLLGLKQKWHLCKLPPLPLLPPPQQ